MFYDNDSSTGDDADDIMIGCGDNDNDESYLMVSRGADDSDDRNFQIVSSIVTYIATSQPWDSSHPPPSVLSVPCIMRDKRWTR